MWGKHAVINLYKCSKVNCPKTILLFNDELVKKIDMVAYGNPFLQHFGTGDKAGFTLVQLIETSNITAHFVDETNDIYLDVFSCKEYDPSIVIEVAKKYFSPKNVHLTILERQARMD